MTNQQEIEALDKHVTLLLEYTMKLRMHIEAHEFSFAVLEASALALYCNSVNIWANRLADKEN